MTRMMKYDDDVMIEMEAMLEEAEAPVSNECCIYRVPFHTRILNEDAYTPSVVSIGPFHHNRHPRLATMERHKLIYCKAFLQRTQTSLTTWIRYIQGVEPEFRRCYSDTLEFTKEELVKIIFVDSGFIFELFWILFYVDEHEPGNDRFLLTPWLSTSIRLDLLLLENQLPFFLLRTLFNLSCTSTSLAGNNNIPTFLQLTLRFFDYYKRSELNFDNISIRHFTDLTRSFHLQYPQQRRKPNLVEHLPSATELSEAGVRFKGNTDSHRCLLDLKFSGGVLEIPQLFVEDGTEVLFRNMVALEQCHYPRDSYITDYVAVMDFLINTSRDVDILVRKGVLVNWLGDTHSVANMFNGLCKNITPANVSSDYVTLCKSLNDFCRNPLHKLKSTLRRDYCHTPWKTAASIAGILIINLVLHSITPQSSVVQDMI
ncbi:UPF0481 protein, partial [Mucuna pruriens]